ncbi:MAG: type II toxin-antitoxin system RelE/ParE family toxin [Pseudomonadota bacterium]
MKEVHFYKTESGDCPIEQFLNELSAKQAQKVLWVLQLIEEVSVLPAQYFNKLADTEDIWEISVQMSHNIFELLGFEDEQLMVLNHAFQNPSQKNQLQEEIKIAESCKRDYLNRK